MSAALSQQTYLPEDPRRMAKVLDFLKAHEDRRGSRPEPRYLLVGGADQVEIPPEVHGVLYQVVEALRGGYGVTVVPQSQTLTTQQVAELLGVSRPTVVKLLEGGQIPFERVGSHRKVRLADAVEFRRHRRMEQYEAILETSTEADEEDLETVRARLRESRKRVTQKRRLRSEGQS